MKLSLIHATTLSTTTPPTLTLLATTLALGLLAGCAAEPAPDPADRSTPTATSAREGRAAAGGRDDRAPATMAAPLDDAAPDAPAAADAPDALGSASSPAPSPSAPPAAGRAEDVAPSPAAPAAPVPAAPPVVPPPSAYRGVNLSGAEFGTALPGKENVDYRWPSTTEVDYYRQKGMNTFRIGFRWERLQPIAKGALDGAYLAKLDALVAHVTSQGSYAILNPHNFARYYGTPVGGATVPAAVFADLWRRLAERFAGNDRVLFNLVNEPNTMPTEQWVGAANAAIAAIRASGARNVIQVPGNGWTGAYSWTHDYYGTPNAVAMLDIADPGNNLVYEVHQYLDADSSGHSDQCVSRSIGSERLAGFVDWLRAHGKKGFVGELAGGDNPTCNAAITDMLASMKAASDVLVGWLWWGGGPWWPADYAFALAPKSGVDQPAMAVLSPFLR